jgi:hypothetical protein
MRLSAWIILGLIGLVLAYPARAAGNVTVTVTGTGITIDAARTDAVRQALQQTIVQLVVVERAIRNDRLVRDSVISTMNGYVEEFHEKSVRKEDSEFLIDADVTISASRIENFIGVASGGSASLNGSSLLAEANREAAQRKARGEIFDRLLRGFPSELLDVRVTAIKPDDANPNSFAIDLEYGFKKEFKKALLDTLRC